MALEIIERWERCGKEEYREGTRGEAVHGVNQLLASACWRMVKTVEHKVRAPCNCVPVLLCRVIPILISIPHFSFTNVLAEPGIS